MFGGESIHAGKIQTGKFNSRRTGFLPEQRQKMVRLANAGALNDTDPISDEVDEQEGVGEEYVYTAPDDNDLLELDDDEETVTPEGEYGVDWI